MNLKFFFYQKLEKTQCKKIKINLKSNSISRLLISQSEINLFCENLKTFKAPRLLLLFSQPNRFNWNRQLNDANFRSFSRSFIRKICSIPPNFVKPNVRIQDICRRTSLANIFRTHQSINGILRSFNLENCFHSEIIYYGNLFSLPQNNSQVFQQHCRMMKFIDHHVT